MGWHRGAGRVLRRRLRERWLRLRDALGIPKITPVWKLDSWHGTRPASPEEFDRRNCAARRRGLSL